MGKEFETLRDNKQKKRRKWATPAKDGLGTGSKLCLLKLCNPIPGILFYSQSVNFSYFRLLLVCKHISCNSFFMRCVNLNKHNFTRLRKIPAPFCIPPFLNISER